MSEESCCVVFINYSKIKSMSRIGKMPVSVPQGVKIQISPANEIEVSGPKGVLKRRIDRDIRIAVNEGILELQRATDQKRHKALHGLSRMLIHNMLQGVSEGFKKQLELVGVGYRAAVQGQLLDLSLGYSHNIIFELPQEIKASVLQEKGQNIIITLESNDNQLLGQVAAKIRMLRKPEPYKGKGVKYVGEVLRRKSGKAAGSK